MVAKKVSAILGIAMLVALLPGQNSVQAHDIDIYVHNSGSTASAESLIMFSLDMRPSVMNATGDCNGYDAGDPTSKCYVLAPYMKDVTETTSISPLGATRLEIYRAAIIKVLTEQVVLKGHNVKIGLMLAHANDNNCAGPYGIELNADFTTKVQPTKKCSNGGYIYFGLRSINNTSVFKTDGSGNFVVDAEGYRTLLTEDPDFTAFKKKIRTLSAADTQPKYQGSEMMFEFYRYLVGRDVYNGFNGYNDYGNSTYNLNEYADYGSATEREFIWDTTITEGTGPAGKPPYAYISPITDNCAKIFTMNFAFGVLNQDADSDTAIKAARPSGMGFGTSLSNQNNARFEDMLERLFSMDLSTDTYPIRGATAGLDGLQNVESYFYVRSPSNTENAWAAAGTGGAVTSAYNITEPEDLVSSLQLTIEHILSTSTTFVAPSVAVNVYNRAQVVDDIFIAMFQTPDPVKPLWPGNLKKIKLGKDTSSGLDILKDVNGDNAVDAINGRISKNALTYWTIRDDIPAPIDLAEEDQYSVGRDGRAVERGGAGSKISGYKLKCDNTSYLNDTSCAPGDYTVGLVNPSGDATNISKRKLFTEPDTISNGSSNALMALEATVDTADALKTFLTGYDTVSGASGDTGTCDADATKPYSACNLLKYARGMLDDADGTESDGSKNRVWLMGSALHSRPLAINYGARGSYTTTNPDIRLFFGTNDGLLRMVRNTDTSTNQDGGEGWGFMPREVMGILKTIKENNGASFHQYGVDGETVAYVLDNDGDGNIESADSDKVYLFFGLRRGGKAYYALNVTDPDNPTLLWKIAKTSGGNFDELGQTWSTPKVTYMVFDGSSTPKPVLIFGGGYDANKDDKSTGLAADHAAQAGLDDSEGNAVYIVGAADGALIWKAAYNSSASTPSYDSTAKTYKRADMFDSIPSTITIVDDDGNGLTDRLYVGDTGGVLWRGDFRSNNDSLWTLKPLLSVGRHAVVSGAIELTADATVAAADDRRFYYAPDYVQTKDADGNSYDAIAIGTGDRNYPLGTENTNYFYVFRDTDTVSGTQTLSPIANADLADITSNCLQEGGCQSTDSAAAGFVDLSKGWRLQMKCPVLNTSPCGEKVLAPAFTIGGTVYFTSYIPQSGTSSCAPKEGNGLLYMVSLQDGSAVEDNTGDNTLTVDDRVALLASGGIPAEVVSLGGGKLLKPDLSVIETTNRSGFKTYWYEKELY